MNEFSLGILIGGALALLLSGLVLTFDGGNKYSMEGAQRHALGEIECTVYERNGEKKADCWEVEK